MFLPDCVSSQVEPCEDSSEPSTCSDCNKLRMRFTCVTSHLTHAKEIHSISESFSEILNSTSDSHTMTSRKSCPRAFSQRCTSGRFHVFPVCAALLLPVLCPKPVRQSRLFKIVDVKHIFTNNESFLREHQTPLRVCDEQTKTKDTTSERNICISFRDE